MIATPFTMEGGSRFERPASEVFHAVTHVWGRAFLDLFLNVCLPNQLAPGNVPALPSGSRYRILTRSADVETLDRHPMVHALRERLPVDIVVVEALDRPATDARRHDPMIACHRRAIADVIEAHAALIVLAADFVLSESALAAVVRRHREGYRAVVNTGLRLAKEPFLKSVRESRIVLAGLSSRELVRLALPHLHRHTYSMCMDAPQLRTFPWAVYWRIGDDGLLARCFSLHPLMIDPMNRLPLKGVIDGGYVGRACPDFSRVHVVTDSDELQMFELTTMKRPFAPRVGRGISAWRAASVAVKCDHHQLAYWRNCTIRLHARDLDERWERAAAASEAFVGKSLRLLPYGRVGRRWFWHLARFQRWIAGHTRNWHLRRRSVRYARVWRRGMPKVTAKQFLRPIRLASHRGSRVLRKGARRMLRHL